MSIKYTDAGGGDGRVQHDEEALHGQYNNDTGGDEDDDTPESRDDNCVTTKEKNNKKDKAAPDNTEGVEAVPTSNNAEVGNQSGELDIRRIFMSKQDCLARRGGWHNET